MTIGLAHMCIVVEDLTRAVRFFVDDLGGIAGPETALEGRWVDALCGLEHVRTRYVPLSWEPHGTRLFLLQYRHPAAVSSSGTGRPNALGYNHANFAVDDIDALVDRLEQGGRWCFFGPVQDVPGTNVRTVYFRGPEEILIQLTQNA